MPAQTRGGKKRQRVLDVNNIPEQLTVGQAAWLLNCGHVKIHRDIHAGRIEVVDLNEGYGIRPLYRIPRDAFLASRGLKHLIPATGKKDGAA